MACDIVQVQFHGDILDCVQDDGKVWFSLRRGCENLGLSMESQLAKLKGKAWATMREIIMDSPDKSQRNLTCIDLDSLPGWLFSIDARKVKEHVREKLARYQKEAARVLADHFLKRTEAGMSPAQLVSLVHDLHALLNEERAAKTQLARRLDALEGRLRELPTVHVPTAATPRETVQTRLRYKEWHGTSRKQRAQIRRLANLRLDLEYNETPDVSGGPGGPCIYWGHQINVLDRAIDEVREIYKRRDEAQGPGLFDPKKAVA